MIGDEGVDGIEKQCVTGFDLKSEFDSSPSDTRFEMGKVIFRKITMSKKWERKVRALNEKRNQI
jgi:hypothetical protein